MSLRPQIVQFIAVFAIGILLIASAQADELVRSGGGPATRSQRNQTTKSAGGCLSNYKEMISRKSSEHWYTISNRTKNCKGALTRKSQFPTAGHLRVYLESEPQFSVGKSNSERLGQCTSQNDHELVALYYYDLNKLEGGAEAVVEQIAAIDNLLGRSTLAGDVNCAPAQLPKLYERCEQIKSCQTDSKNSAAKLKQLAEESEAAYRELNILRSKMLQLSSIRFKAKATIDGETLTSAQMQERHKQLSEAYRALKARFDEKYPWMHNKPAKTSSEEALRRYLNDTRVALLNEYNRFENASICVSGRVPAKVGCDIKDIEKALERAPAFSPGISMNKEKVKDAVAAAQFMDYATCFDDAATDFKNTNSTVTSAVAGAGMTVATLGLAPIALGTRAAFVSSRLNTAAKAMSRITLGNAYAVMTKDQVVQTAELCSQEARALQAEVNKTPSVADQCPGADTTLARATEDYESCVTASLMLGVELLSFAPGTPAAMRALKQREKMREIQQRLKLKTAGKDIQIATNTSDNVERVQRAEKLLGRRLTEEQRACLIEAHSIGMGKVGADGTAAKLNNYTFAQKTAKGRTLMKCGFTRAETKAVMDAGIAGEGDTFLDLLRRPAKSQSDSVASLTPAQRFEAATRELEEQKALVERMAADPNTNPYDLLVARRQVQSMEQQALELKRELPESRSEFEALLKKEFKVGSSERTIYSNDNPFDVRDVKNFESLMSPEERAALEKMMAESNDFDRLLKQPAKGSQAKEPQVERFKLGEITIERANGETKIFTGRTYEKEIKELDEQIAALDRSPTPGNFQKRMELLQKKADLELVDTPFMDFERDMFQALDLIPANSTRFTPGQQKLINELESRVALRQKSSSISDADLKLMNKLQEVKNLPTKNAAQMRSDISRRFEQLNRTADFSRVSTPNLRDTRAAFENISQRDIDSLQSLVRKDPFRGDITPQERVVVKEMAKRYLDNAANYDKAMQSPAGKFYLERLKLYREALERR